MRRAVALAGVALLMAAGPAAAQVQLPAKPQTKSLDSEAPPDAPPHWLPTEPWVMQHWLPYDEEALYAELGITRGDVWRQLRDDTRDLEDLIAAKGRDARDVARKVVAASWAADFKEPGRRALLEKRALRTLTQGHLAQHIFFHSLHQDAIPDNAPAIFGVASRAQFAALRRSELSPLQICRLNGLSRSHAQREAERTLRAMAARGVDGEAIPAAQAKRLLGRQLRQVPRWLQQTRYNGPPPLKTPRASAATASNYSNNAVIAADGGSVAYEGYEAKLADAKSRGEIGVLARPLSHATPFLVSARPALAAPRPQSAYNPAISADGRFVAYELAPGNLNFAKRYGQMTIRVRDVRAGRTYLGSPAAPVGKAPRSAYNPSISGDGRLVAYESSEAARGDLDVFVTDVTTKRTRKVQPRAPGVDDVYEPRLSGDGNFVVFTALPRAQSDATSQVFRQDLRTGRTVLVSGGEAEAYEPEISADGRWVAFTVLDAQTRQARVLLRDLRTKVTATVAPRAGDGLAGDATASDPALSADGRSVAFVARGATSKRGAVYVRDIDLGRTELVSRADGRDGASADGSAVHPSISADGRYVTFTTDAWNLSHNKCNSARGVFVRDRTAAATALLSSGDGANRYLGPTKGSSEDADMTVALLCS